MVRKYDRGDKEVNKKFNILNKEVRMKYETLAKLIHNLANDLKSGLITWPEFDSRLLSLLADWK